MLSPTFGFDFVQGANVDFTLPGYKNFDFNASSSRHQNDQWDESAFMDLFSSVVSNPETSNSSLARNEGGSQKSLATFELLNTYRNGLQLPAAEEPKQNRIKLPAAEEAKQKRIELRPKLSTGDILRVAGERFIRFRTKKSNVSISPFNHPYGSSLSDFSVEDARDVELVHVLLAAADYMGSHRYDIASTLITRCSWVASNSGTPVQRIVFYLVEALMSRIGRETGTINQEAEKQNMPKEQELGHDNTVLECHQKLPFAQLLQICAVQAIIECVKRGGKVHVIDLHIGTGICWTALMQGLMDYGIKRLKVTAVGTGDQLYMEETGKRLVSFAQSLSLPFCFEVVYLQDMNDFNVDCVSVEADETVVIYASLVLRTMLSRPQCLENVMKEITKLEPDLMVVVEVEANHNSPSFVGRFVESLFFYGAFFDCLNDCMGEDSPCRAIIEAERLGKSMRNTIAAEGQDRVVRNVKINVWRAFLARYMMREIDLSESARYQAHLVLKKFENERSWDLEHNGKGLVVGWKGTPIHSLTIWKFT